MALRPTWRGHLRLALVSCPVRLTPATTSSSNIRFHKLNRKTGNRLKQQMIDSETGKTVERDETIMGYEFEKGKYVKVEPEEIDALKIESSEIITIERTHLHRLLREGKITDETRRRIERDLDLEEAVVNNREKHTPL